MPGRQHEAKEQVRRAMQRHLDDALSRLRGPDAELIRMTLAGGPLRRLTLANGCNGATTSEIIELHERPFRVDCGPSFIVR